MPLIKKAFNFIIFVLFKNKLKWLVFWIASFLFLLFMFPFGDLGDLVTSKVAEATNNNVIFQFDDMNFALPLSVNFKDISFQNKGSQAIKADSLKVTPSLLSLLKLKPGFTASAHQLFDGDLNISLASQGKSNDGNPLQGIDINFDKINLKKVSSSIPSKVPLQLQGLITGAITAAIDQTFKEAPESEFNITSPEVLLLPISFNQGGLQLELPRMQWSALKLKGRLINDELIIEDGVLGTTKDNLSLRFKGTMGLKFIAKGKSIAPNFTSYDLRMDVQTVGEVDPTLKLAFLPITQFKSATVGGERYLFKASSRSLRSNPNFSKIKSL